MARLIAIIKPTGPSILASGRSLFGYTLSFASVFETTLPFYTSPQLLREGLTYFSVETGFPRLRYGTDSNNYAPKEMASSVYYNRGVFQAAVHVEAIRNALKAKPDGKITGVDTKAGFEKISGFTLGGLVPPLKMSTADHEGGGLVQIWQVKGGKFEKVTEWFSAYPDVIAKHTKDAAAK